MMGRQRIQSSSVLRANQNLPRNYLIYTESNLSYFRFTRPLQAYSRSSTQFCSIRRRLSVYIKYCCTKKVTNQFLQRTGVIKRNINLIMTLAGNYGRGGGVDLFYYRRHQSKAFHVFEQNFGKHPLTGDQLSYTNLSPLGRTSSNLFS